MRVLLVGAGGREHALAWKISQSPLCEQLFIAPGNAGTHDLGKNVYLSPTDFLAMESLVEEERIDLIVVGPEQPLVVGISDYFEARGIPVVGPDQKAAQLEGSKAFAKSFMRRYRIPTAAYESFDQDQLGEAINYLKDQQFPIVVKASGLAAGKGVLICQDYAEAAHAVTQMLSGEAFGSSGRSIVIEEFLQGTEVSVFVLTDGKDYLLLPTAKDYKRVGEGDTGLNTGGMGAVSPTPFETPAFLARIKEEIVLPTLNGLQEDEITFKGFIFIGLMIVEGEPYVLEYNVRMGDPETQVIMPRIQSDVLEMLAASAKGTLSKYSLEISPDYCTTVVLASGGYPGPYEKGKLITGLSRIQNSWVFHAGTIHDGEQIITNGGRVLAISSLGKHLEEALHLSLTNAVNIEYEGKYYRTDIGADLIGKS
ncbi:MAG: phosphoribosylamine--glycine ligase [Bacteroidota bacterium]